MAEMPFFPLATDAFLADTDHLDDAERGRYLSILIALWRAPKQRLPNDDKWLAKKFKRDVERVQSELRPIILEFCQCDGNWITQKRLTKEFSRATKAVQQRRDAANARWLKEKQERERIAASHTFRKAIIPTPTLIHSESEARELSVTEAPRSRAKRPSMAELAALHRARTMGQA